MVVDAERSERHRRLEAASLQRSREGTPEDARFEPVRRRRPPTAIRYLQTGQPCDKQLGSLVTEIRAALRTLRSRRVPAWIHDGRTAICADCRYTVHVQRPDRIDIYCRCCPCGQWSAAGTGSSVDDKNWYAGYGCPHDPPQFGPYTGKVTDKIVPWWKLPVVLTRAATATLFRPSPGRGDAGRINGDPDEVRRGSGPRGWGLLHRRDRPKT